MIDSYKALGLLIRGSLPKDVFIQCYPSSIDLRPVVRIIQTSDFIKRAGGLTGMEVFLFRKKLARYGHDGKVTMVKCDIGHNETFKY